VVFDQTTVAYFASSDAFTAGDYILLPYLDPQEIREYGRLLSSQIAAFEDVETPISRPEFPAPLRENEPLVGDSGTDDSGAFPDGIVAGVVVPSIVLLIVAGVIYHKRSGKSERQGEPTDSLRPPLPQQGEYMQGLEPRTVVEVLENPPALPQTCRLPTVKDQARSVEPPLGHPEDAPMTTKRKDGLPEYF